MGLYRGTIAGFDRKDAILIPYPPYMFISYYIYIISIYTTLFQSTIKLNYDNGLNTFLTFIKVMMDSNLHI